MKKRLMVVIIIMSLVLVPINKFEVRATENTLNLTSGTVDEIGGEKISLQEGKTITREYVLNNGVEKEFSDCYVEKIEKSDDDVEKVHEMTVSYTIPEEALEEEIDDGWFSITVLADSGSNSYSKSDKTGTIQCYSTVKYSIIEKKEKSM